MSRPVENNANGSQSGYDWDEEKKRDRGSEGGGKTDGGIKSEGGMGVSHWWDEWMSGLADDGKISLSFVLFSGIPHSAVVSNRSLN